MARESTTAVAIREATASIESPEFRQQIQAALPDHVSVDRFVRVARTAIVQNPDLITKGDRASILAGLIRCAQDGLLPDGREAALVLFGNKAAYMPMVGGLRKIAAQHGVTLVATVVYSHDEFAYELGWEPSVTHRPPPLDQPRGEPIGAYAVATDTEGRRYLEVMSRQEIEQVRAVSRAKGQGPWSDWWGEMARKTVARRLWKQLPLGAHEDAARVLESTEAEAELPRVERTLSVPAAPELVAADAAFDEDPAPVPESDTVDAEVVSDEEASYFQARLAEAQGE